MGNWKRLASILLVGTMTVTLAACGSSSSGSKDEGGGKDEKVKLNVLFNNTDENVEKEMAYVQEHLPEKLPNVEVEFEMSPGDAQTYETKVRTMISAGGEGLDVWWERGGSWATPILESESALPLDDYLEKSGYWDKVIPSANVPAEDGHTYAIPFEDISYEIILYNKKIFEEHGWKIPQTWSELMNLCDEIQAAGLQPFTMGFKDTWTCLAPWNGLAVDLAPSDVCRQVNQGKTTFTENYREVAEKMLQLLSYGPKDPFAYNYNDACTAFARGEAVMYPIGSYAVPQIQSVNPDMEIDSFVFPGSDKKEENTLNSGIDLQFCVTKECKNKEAAYEVLDFLLEDENVQDYLNEQNSVPCKEGEFELSPMLDGVRQYIEEENMADYQDHYYPSEMAVDAQIQTLLIDKDVDAFLKKFDKDWQRYNRDIIQKVQKYEAEQTHSK